MFRRLEESPDIAQLRRDERAVDDFFRQHYRAEEPAADLWPRITRQLATPVPSPAPFLSFNRPAPRLLLTAAAAVLLVAALVFITPWTPGPSRQEMLSAIDSRYEVIWTAAATVETNPFDGRGILESTADENPFQTATQPTAADPRPDDNPFRPLLEQY
jgi:hypothetical protein